MKPCCAGKCADFTRYPGFDVQTGEKLQVFRNTYFESECVDHCLDHKLCMSATHVSDAATCYLKTEAPTDPPAGDGGNARIVLLVCNDV